ncbi:hypothetical protein, partial [Methylobacterium crusticola]
LGHGLDRGCDAAAAVLRALGRDLATGLVLAGASHRPDLLRPAAEPVRGEARGDADGGAHGGAREAGREPPG